MTKVCYSELTTIRNNLRDVVPLDTPYALFIDPTNFCNFHCSFCPRNLECFHEYAGKYVHMDMELYKKIISDIKMFPKKLKVSIPQLIHEIEPSYHLSVRHHSYCYEETVLYAY